jgi:hypothetical protein
VSGYEYGHFPTTNKYESEWTIVASLLFETEGRETLRVSASGHYMYHQFNIQQFYVLPTQYINVFCVDLITNIDYIPIQH